MPAVPSGWHALPSPSQCSRLSLKSPLGQGFGQGHLFGGPGTAEAGSEPSPLGGGDCVRAQGPGPRENWPLLDTPLWAWGAPERAPLCCHPPSTGDPGTSNHLHPEPSHASQSPSTSTWASLPLASSRCPTSEATDSSPLFWILPPPPQLQKKGPGDPASVQTLSPRKYSPRTSASWEKMPHLRTAVPA